MAASAYRAIDVDGASLFIPDTPDLTDDDVERLRHDGRAVDVDGDRVDIKWAFWRPQREAFDAIYSGDYDVVGMVAGFRSGKSVTGARAAVEVALNPTFAPSRSIVMGVSYAEAKKTTYPVLFEEMPGGSKEELDPFLYAGDPEESPLVANFSKQDGVITWYNNSVTILGSADKPSRYKGGKFSFAWLDEIAHYQTNRIHGIRKTIAERFDLGPPACQLWTTTGNGYNPVFDVLERRVGEDDQPLGANVKLITASSENNPFLSADDRSRLRRTHEGTKTERQALHGAFEAAEGAVYGGFRRHTHVVDVTDDGRVPDYDTAIDGDWRIYGYDAGWDNPRVFLEIAKTDYGQFIVVDEFYESESHVEDVVGGPNHDRYWADGKPAGVVYAEHNPGDIQKMRSRGWRAGKADKSIDDGIDTVRYRLRTDHEGMPGLLVSNECGNLISEFHGYTEDDVGSSDADDHALDALRYALHTHSRRGSDGGDTDTVVDKA